MTEDAHRPQRRRPTIAKEWQLAVLKRLQSESGNPTEEQRSAAAAETGLGEKWVKNWFTRQRSKVAARSRKNQLAVHSATVPTFRVQLCHPPQGMPSRRSVSTPVDPAPCLPSPISPQSRSPRPSSPIVNTRATSRSRRSVSVPVPLVSPAQDPSLVTHTATIPTYSRDPLCNRFPDFSQFFRPRVHERFHSFQLSAPISNHDHFIRLVASMDSHVPMHFQMAYPFHTGDLPAGPSYSTSLQSCPVAFPMKLVDLVRYSSLVQYPVLPPPELGCRV